MRSQLKALYPDRPWLDVRSKSDLPLAAEVEPSSVPEGCLHVSVTDGSGVDELKRSMARLVGGEAEELPGGAQ